MTTLKNKIDFAVIFRVTKANPNGDPLNGNRPRIDFAGHGEVTDVCLKRKARDRLLDRFETLDVPLRAGQAIFVQSDERQGLRGEGTRQVQSHGLRRFYGYMKVTFLASAGSRTAQLLEAMANFRFQSVVRSRSPRRIAGFARCDEKAVGSHQFVCAESRASHDARVD